MHLVLETRIDASSLLIAHSMALLLLLQRKLYGSGAIESVINHGNPTQRSVRAHAYTHFRPAPTRRSFKAKSWLDWVRHTHGNGCGRPQDQGWIQAHPQSGALVERFLKFLHPAARFAHRFFSIFFFLAATILPSESTYDTLTIYYIIEYLLYQSILICLQFSAIASFSTLALN
jgi:hypothetical protein